MMKKDWEYDLFFSAIRSRFKDAVIDHYNPHREMTFYPNSGAYNRGETYTCFRDRDGHFIIKKEY